MPAAEGGQLFSLVSPFTVRNDLTARSIIKVYFLPAPYLPSRKVSLMHIRRSRSQMLLERLELRDCPAAMTVAHDSANNYTIQGAIDPAGLTVQTVGNNTVNVTNG